MTGGEEEETLIFFRVGSDIKREKRRTGTTKFQNEKDLRSVKRTMTLILRERAERHFQMSRVQERKCGFPGLDS